MLFLVILVTQLFSLSPRTLFQQMFDAELLLLKKDSFLIEDLEQLSVIESACRLQAARSVCARQCLFFDIDGTLIDSYVGRVSTENIQIFLALLNQGKKITFVTSNIEYNSIHFLLNPILEYVHTQLGQERRKHMLDLIHKNVFLVCMAGSYALSYQPQENRFTIDTTYEGGALVFDVEKKAFFQKVMEEIDSEYYGLSHEDWLLYLEFCVLASKRDSFQWFPFGSSFYRKNFLEKGSRFIPYENKSQFDYKAPRVIPYFQERSIHNQVLQFKLYFFPGEIAKLETSFEKKQQFIVLSDRMRQYTINRFKQSFNSEEGRSLGVDRVVFLFGGTSGIDIQGTNKYQVVDAILDRYNKKSEGAVFFGDQCYKLNGQGGDSSVVSLPYVDIVAQTVEDKALFNSTLLWFTPDEGFNRRIHLVNLRDADVNRTFLYSWVVLEMALDLLQKKERLHEEKPFSVLCSSSWLFYSVQQCA